VRRHFSTVFRFFRSKLSFGVEDLVQRTFLACVEARQSFLGKGSFKAFLLGIARNQLLRHLQRELPRYPDPLELSVAAVHAATDRLSPSGVVADHEEHSLLLSALRRIPLNLQMTIELHYWEELTVEEISQVMAVPVGTVKTRLRRARMALREAVEQMNISPALRETTLGNLDGWARSLRDLLKDPEAERA
jgi:RNA polymerase sigma-70 factor (ECF subfamily)